MNDCDRSCNHGYVQQIAIAKTKALHEKRMKRINLNSRISILDLQRNRQGDRIRQIIATALRITNRP